MLIICKECGKEVSDTAKRCPHCGAKIEKTKVKAEKAAGSEKAKGNHFVLMIASCAIAIGFLIMTLLAFVAPRTFLNSKTWRDFSDLFTQLPDYNYKITIQDKTYYMNCGTYGFNFLLDSSSQVQCYFRDDGSVQAYVFFNGSGAHCEADYDYHGTDAVLVQSWRNYQQTSFSSIERALADVTLELTEAVLNYVLLINHRTYGFDDVLISYANYRNSLNGIRISSLILMSVFTIISVFVIVFYKKRNKKREQAAAVLQDGQREPITKEAKEALKFYKEMLDSGAITQEQFDRRTKDLLR